MTTGCWRVCVWLLASVWLSQAHAGPYTTARDRAVQWLESQQNSNDGSWQDVSEARTFLQTSEVVLGLHMANHRQAPYYAGQTWLENHDPKNVDARARRLLVSRSSQANVQADIDALMAAVAPDAAGYVVWGLNKRYRASPLDTAVALEALTIANAGINQSQAVGFLKSSQRFSNGDYGWAAANGDASDPFVTARVIQTLALFKADATVTVPLANAVATLTSRVSTSSSPHVRAAAALALLRYDANSTYARTLLNSLLPLQRGDGGFDAGVLTTGLIVQALAAAEGVDAVNSRERVDIPDAALRAAINAALGRGSLDQLNRGELSLITTLDITGKGVSSLTGLQYATSLAFLYAANNNITDTSPLAGLTSLIFRDLNGNPCAGCSPNAGNVNGDVPIPWWALAALAAGLMGMVGRAGRRRTDKE